MGATTSQLHSATTSKKFLNICFWMLQILAIAGAGGVACIVMEHQVLGVVMFALLMTSFASGSALLISKLEPLGKH
jgi:hypothetical protein